ncbi:a18b1bd1-363d-459c-a945-5384508d1c57 [Thermothielavioides terrestris]|uniref:A18b1bd1-363d-459c-a945-5384508d1c57 n=1 Tax=Thermothielavioides terrestris TaxID=2587410 RepID=A0A446BUP4_9PEZI|nr:a18b1bd1-363d-459c-a945-5384508d1c57 [Thermothielavioides terrestris]
MPLLGTGVDRRTTAHFRNPWGLVLLHHSKRQSLPRRYAVRRETDYGDLELDTADLDDLDPTLLAA